MQTLEELRKLNKEELYCHYFRDGYAGKTPKEINEAYKTMQSAIENYFAVMERVAFYEGFHHALAMLERKEENNGK